MTPTIRSRGRGQEAGVLQRQPGLAGARAADDLQHGGGGKGEHGMGLDDGGPHAGGDLAVCLVQQLVRLRGEFLGAAEVLRSGHGCSSRLAVRYGRDNQGTACVAALTAGIPYRGLTRCAVRW
jgi:hypothetical protein